MPSHLCIWTWIPMWSYGLRRGVRFSIIYVTVRYKDDPLLAFLAERWSVTWNSSTPVGFHMFALSSDYLSPTARLYSSTNLDRGSRHDTLWFTGVSHIYAIEGRDIPQRIWYMYAEICHCPNPNNPNSLCFARCNQTQFQDLMFWEGTILVTRCSYKNQRSEAH